MQWDHSQRAAGCCRHSGEFFHPPDWVSAGVRDESPPPPTISCDGWHEHKLNAPWGPWRQTKATRAGQGFFPPLTAKKYLTMTTFSDMFQFTLSCITVPHKVTFPSTVRNTMSRSRILPLILPLCLLSKYMLVLAVVGGAYQWPICYSPAEYGSGEWRKFPLVVVSLSVRDLEVNTANEVRGFSMTHAKFLSEVNSRGPFSALFSSQNCEILFSSLWLCSCT